MGGSLFALHSKTKTIPNSQNVSRNGALLGAKTISRATEVSQVLVYSS
jgi:hypothetical protein